MLPHRYHAPLRGNAWERAAATIAAEVFPGVEMVQDYDQLLDKRPGKGDAVFAWHQDMAPPRRGRRSRRSVNAARTDRSIAAASRIGRGVRRPRVRGALGDAAAASGVWRLPRRRDSPLGR